MLARIRKAIREKDQGFTLIELLVVMIIIGILAAIAIPVFLSQRAKAQDSAVKADVSALGKEMSTWFVDANVDPPTIYVSSSRYKIGATSGTAATATDVGKVSDGVILLSTYTAPSGTITQATSLTNSAWTSSAWCIALYNSNGSQKVYRFSAQNGLEAGNCASATAPTAATTP